MRSPRVLAPILLCAPLAAQYITWKDLSTPAGLSPRYGAAMVYDSGRDRLVLVGGTNNNGSSAFRETWEHDGTSWSLRSQVGPQGSAIWYPAEVLAAAYDAQRQRTVVLQSNPSNNQSQTWEWNGTAWSLRSSGATPPGRTGMAMAFDEANGVTVLFGGKSNYTGHLSDTWEWDGTAWVQRSSGGPIARQGHAMAYDAARGVVVLFGGRLDVSPNTVFGDTWEWNGQYWVEYFGVAGPSARYGHSMAFDAARGVVLLRGGRDSNYQNVADTWEWSGGQWTNRGVFGDNAEWTTMAYDQARERAAVFGGRDLSSQPLDDTLVFADVAHIAATAPFGSGCAGPNGVPALAAIPGSKPLLGTTFTMRLSNLPTGILNLPVGFLGFDSGQWNGVPLPFALDPLGFPGCTALLAPSGTYTLTNASGVADWSLDVPFVPAMAGLLFYAQGGVLVLGYNPGGMVFSGALVGRVGA